MIREKTEEIEEQILSPIATRSKNARREREEKPCEIRTAFQVDRDRILHSKAFRRLKRKTQVLILPKGDHYRTRLTHTLEVSQISRTIGRALRLNEDLIEAISLGHDVGHTPFGHAGEEVLREILPEGFHHAPQSIRVLEKIEKKGEGLNLTVEVKDGILKHSKGLGEILPSGSGIPITPEAKVVRLSDIIAYLNHDLDDALRAEIITEKDIPQSVKNILGVKYGQRIDTMVKAVIKASYNKGDIFIDENVYEEMKKLRAFMFERVYNSKEVVREVEKAKGVLFSLYEYYIKHPGEFEEDSQNFLPDEKFERRVADFIAGMTDEYALELWSKKFFPKSLY